MIRIYQLGANVVIENYKGKTYYIPTHQTRLSLSDNGVIITDIEPLNIDRFSIPYSDFFDSQVVGYNFNMPQDVHLYLSHFIGSVYTADATDYLSEIKNNTGDKYDEIKHLYLPDDRIDKILFKKNGLIKQTKTFTYNANKTIDIISTT